MATPTSSNARSEASSPRLKFDADSLRSSLRPLLESKLSSFPTPWPSDRDLVRRYSYEIKEEVKAKMLELERGRNSFKYIVHVQLMENRGQGGRADLGCHWEPGDVSIQETFSNNDIICTVLACAIRAY